MQAIRQIARFHRLSNGLRLLCLPNASSPVVTYQTWFEVGARDEKLDPRLQATGLAHLFEHMMFRGTKTLGDGEFDKTLALNGVYGENATTWLDRTNYYESVPAEKLELVMRLEADRMVNLVIDETVLDTEREVVLGEYRMGLDDPDSVAFDHLFDAAYTQHPYKFTTIGTEEEIKRFSKSDADYFYGRFYAPNNAYVIVAGDVDPTRVFELAEKCYGGYPAQQIQRVPAPREPVQTAARKRQFTHAQLADPKVVLGYHAPEVTHADHAALWVAHAHLSQGEGSALQAAWVDSGIAASQGGFLGQFRDPGLFVLSADLQGGREPEELLEALDRVIAAGIRSEDELERARNQLLLETLGQADENSALASYLGEFVASAGDPMFGLELLERVKQVKPDDARSAMARYLRPENRTAVIGLPADEAEKEP
jgi:zinc protease